YGFIETTPLAPFSTSREGVFVCGGSCAPRDISETVVEGLAAACSAAEPLSGLRWRDIVNPVLPEEICVSGQEPRIGIFICNCGVNIGGIVDVPAVKEYAGSLPHVVYADQFLFTCSQDTQEKIKNIIHEMRLNRVIVASCSTRTHEPIFQSLIRDAGLNKYLFEMANIRDQCSWVHMHDRENATRKAKDLVRMAAANALYIEPLGEMMLHVERSALVVGGGIAGMTAARNLADQGYMVHLVEKGNELGGNLRNIFSTLEGIDTQEFLHETIGVITRHPGIRLYMNAQIIDTEGSRGNFLTDVMISGEGGVTQIKHGVTIIATGASEYKPEGLYLYGEDNRVMTQLELEAALNSGSLKRPETCVMIQCVGSRDRDRPYCSRVCCISAIKNAMKIKSKWPDTDIAIMFRDMMSYGFLEKYYKDARRLGIRFVRFQADEPPLVERVNGGLAVKCADISLGETVVYHADRIVLSCAVIPHDTKTLATIFKIPRTREGFFHEAHMKLKPIDFAADGIYMAGTCHSPKNISESIAQAQGAAARALTTLAKDTITTGGIVAKTDPDTCAACLTCIRVCPFGVPYIDENGRAAIDAGTCKGCGTCVSECPAKAIDLMHSRDRQIKAKVGAAIK
ncbi:MAG: FAD-dependent oxidoreductase, partial [Syntrophorhabdus sp.]